jgi:putative glutamine amidotransferase
MKSPLIGITTTHILQPSAPLPLSGVSEAYIRAIRRAGGTPLLIPSGLNPGEAQALRSRLDGILFTGGGDIDPAIFNGIPHEQVYGIIPERDQTELDLVRLAAESRWPFMGICRGIQVINVALGGSLYTHIEGQLPGALRHDYSERSLLVHSVEVQPGTHLAQILGKTSVQTNSLHHQGVEQVAPSLVALGRSPDGLVEAVELPGNPFGLAVQWHPEWLQDIEEMRNLFDAFVRAAGGAA